MSHQKKTRDKYLELGGGEAVWQHPLTCKRRLHCRDQAALGSRYLVRLSA